MTADPRPDLAEIDGLCHDCGRAYGDEHGFPDLVLPPEDWAEISPTGDENGLLCPSCICKRAHAAGLECAANFRSGPFAVFDKDDELTTLRALLSAETERADRAEARGARYLLAAYDAFLSGRPITEAQKATADHVARASAFGSAAYDAGICDGQATHAMIRSILVALIDPMHPDLDYLRADPEAARKARAAAPRAEGEVADAG